VIIFYLTFGNLYTISVMKLKKKNLKTIAKEMQPVFGFRTENQISGFRSTFLEIDC